MAYEQNIPQPTDKIKDSQADLLNNFQAIKTAFDVNHEALTGLIGNEGKHKFVTLTAQAGDPNITGNELVLFDKVATAAKLDATRTLFIRKNAAGNRQFIPLTNGTTTITSVFSDASGGSKHGFAFLGTGFCMKFGNETLDNLGAGGMGALANNQERSSYISLDVTGPDFLAAAKYLSAQLTLCPEAVLNMGTNNTMVYIRWASCTNTQLAITVVNQTGAAMPANTRIYYQVIGQVDLENA